MNNILKFDTNIYTLHKLLQCISNIDVCYVFLILTQHTHSVHTMFEYKSIVEEDSLHNWHYYLTNVTVNQYFVNKFIPVENDKMALLGQDEWKGSLSPYDTIEIMLSQDNSRYFCPSYDRDYNYDDNHS